MNRTRSMHRGVGSRGAFWDAIEGDLIQIRLPKEPKM